MKKFNRTFDKKSVYMEKLSHHVDAIYEICKEEGIPSIISVTVSVKDNGVVGRAVAHHNPSWEEADGLHLLMHDLLSGNLSDRSKKQVETIYNFIQKGGYRYNS